MKEREKHYTFLFFFFEGQQCDVIISEYGVFMTRKKIFQGDPNPIFFY